MLDIRVAGTGCRNCQELEARVKRALVELDVEASIAKLTDFREIAAAGVLATPGLIVDGKVALQGRVPSVADLKALLEGAARR